MKSRVGSVNYVLSPNFASQEEAVTSEADGRSLCHDCFGSPAPTKEWSPWSRKKYHDAKHDGWRAQPILETPVYQGCLELSQSPAEKTERCRPRFFRLLRLAVWRESLPSVRAL